MGRVLIVGGLVALAFAVFAVVDCALTERGRIRALPRAAWIALILLLPVVGGVLWFLVGRDTAERPAAGRPTGPDDDPEFLRTAGSGPRPGEPDWQRLEQELVDMDTDTDDDADGRRR